MSRVYRLTTAAESKCKARQPSGSRKARAATAPRRAAPAAPDRATHLVLFGKAPKSGAVAVSRIIRDGAAPAVIDRLAEQLELSRTAAAALLRIPAATLKRRRAVGRLLPDESSRVIRFTRLLDQATAMMNGDPDEAREWLKASAAFFDGETPLERACTEYGAHEVEDLIGRIRHGIPS